MRPELFRFFDVGAPAYFVLLLSGFLFAITAQALTARRVGENPDVMVDLGIAMLLAGVVGARIHHVLADGYLMDYVHLCTEPSKVGWRIEQRECLSPSYDGNWDAALGVCHPKHGDCFAWAKFWAGGLAFYGGFIAASLVGLYTLKRDKFPVWKAVDMAGFTIPLGLAFGRLGCYLAGCCFGSECKLPWAVSFPGWSDASRAEWKAGTLGAASLPSHLVHPTQLYESLASLGISAFCALYLWPRKRYDGHVMVGFLVLYAVARFAIEFLRRDDRGIAILSTSQWIALAMIALGIAIHQVRGRKSASRKEALA